MAQLKRIARSRAVKGVGYARRGVVHDVPDDLVKDLLKTGEWEEVKPKPQRQPATADAKATEKPKSGE